MRGIIMFLNNKLNLVTSMFLAVLFSFSYADVTLSLDGSDLNYSSTEDIAGFQFSHNGCVGSASGGDAAANGFAVSASGSAVIAFSFSGAVIPAGEGTLVELSGNVTQDCLSDFIFSDASGNSLEVSWAGDSADDGGDICNDIDACNDGQDGECIYPEENYDCNGNCIVDIDCEGECGGDAVVDECGECACVRAGGTEGGGGTARASGSSGTCCSALSPPSICRA